MKLLNKILESLKHPIIRQTHLGSGDNVARDKIVNVISVEKNIKDIFTALWFKHHIENCILNLGRRYTPELNFDLRITEYFNGLCKNDKFYEEIEKRLHELIVKTNSASSYLKEDAVKGEKENIEQLIKQISDNLSSRSVTTDINVSFIKSNLSALEETFSDCYNKIKKEVSGKRKERDSQLLHEISQAIASINKFATFIEGNIVGLSNSPYLLLTGSAGVGKSHLLADISSHRIEEDLPSVMILGQHLTSEEPPWTQILRNLLRIDCDEKKLLGALNDIANEKGERVLFVIDAINEGKGKFFWPDHIASFINDFSDYPMIALVLSVRSSYEKLIVPEKMSLSKELIRVEHQGFLGVEYEASSFFFSQYEIEQPSVPLLHPEFSNPLFLRLFCEGISNSGLSKIPKGYVGISNIIDYFIDSIDNKLSQPQAFDYPSGRKVIRRVVDGLIESKLESGTSYVAYDDAFEIADKVLGKYSNKKRFLDALISEGVFSKNIFWDGDGNCEEGVYFAYERFDDHLTAAFLLKIAKKKESLEQAFSEEGFLYKYIDNVFYCQGLLEAIAIQLPEIFHKELFDFLSEENRNELGFLEVFIYSLIWRKQETIGEDTRKYINGYVLQYEQSFDQFVQMMYTVCSDPDHFYNSNRLHAYLMKFSLADRDQLWTTYLHHHDSHDSAIYRLVEWATRDDNKLYLSNESKLLSAKALSWVLVTTNISLRDLTTKSLVVLLTNNIPLVVRLLSEFEEVDDWFVAERLYAATYGVILRSSDYEGIADLVKHILNNIFNKDEVFPHVLVRDYARNIVEYALHKKLIVLDDPSVIRPPYKSSFPSNFPSNEDIDKYKFDYKSDDFKEYYWSQNAILNSMVTEYGRGTGGYGDFGRYTFESAFRNWREFDANDLSNYACKLIFTKYGYDVEKHGLFDKNASSRDRHKNSKERIGKKYQWFSLFEVLAKLSDNYQMVDPSTSWSKEAKKVWYQGPWEPFVRNIDPTVIAHSSNKYNKVILPEFPDFSDWEGSNESWLAKAINLPSAKSLIAVDIEGDEWLVLENHISWNEPLPIGEDRYHVPHKHLWYQVRSYLIEAKEEIKLLSWLKGKNLMGRWFPEGGERYQLFSRELYWSPAYHYFQDPYYGWNEWSEVSDSENSDKIIAKVLPTTVGMRWETGSEDAKVPSYIVPCETLYSGMNLDYSEKVGQWNDTKGEVVCFDPSTIHNGYSSLLVKKENLFRFLKDNNLKIFWTCLGEKNIHGTGFGGDRFGKWLCISGVCSVVDDELTVETKIF